jgi:hypothetical protein
MRLPLPQGLTVLPQQVRLATAARQIPTLTHRPLRILSPRAIPPMLFMAAVRMLQQQPTLPGRLRLMF